MHTILAMAERKIVAGIIYSIKRKV